MVEENVYPEIGEIVNQKYQVTQRIGAGAFGAIFEVQDIEDGKVYAIKLEKHLTTSPQLQYEYKIYQLLDAPVGIPKVYGTWSESKYKGMVMDKLGLSLGSLFRRSGKKLSLKTVCMVGIQMLCRLEYLHSRSFIHRDIKPDNFVFGFGRDSGLLNLIDLGLSQKYRDLSTLVHINYEEGKGMAGTARYVSINCHGGVQQSRRDDLESIGYVLISLVKGFLPWQKIEETENSHEQYEKISQCKMDTTLKVLCEDLPDEFVSYMQKVRDLRFDENPPYFYLRGLFINLMAKMNYAFDYQYDWVTSKKERLALALKGDKNEFDKVTQEKIYIEKITQKNALRYLQPLPLSGALTEAAAFVGRSQSSGQPITKQKVQYPPHQNMFYCVNKKPSQEAAKIVDQFEAVSS